MRPHILILVLMAPPLPCHTGGKVDFDGFQGHAGGIFDFPLDSIPHGVNHIFNILGRAGADSDIQIKDESVHLAFALFAPHVTNFNLLQPAGGVIDQVLYDFVGKSKLAVIAAFVCIAGMYLLCIAGGIDEIYVADILELMCAVAFTIHMFTVDKYDKADGVKLSCIQFLTSGILSGILMLIFDKADINSVMKAIIPILYAGVMSSGIAYTLQIIGQKYAKPSVTAIVLSLESVFAALAGWILLGEHLSTRELTGCILVFTAVIITQIPQFTHNVDDSKQQVIE